MAMITNVFIKMIMGHVARFRMMDSNVASTFSKKCSSSITRQLAAAVVDEELLKFIFLGKGISLFRGSVL